MAPHLAPVRMSTAKIRLADADLTAPDTDKGASARWATRLNDFTFCSHERLSSRHQVRSRHGRFLF